MIKNRRWLLSGLAAVLLFGIASVARSAELHVPIYQATYSLGLGSLSAGSTHFTLKRNADGSYSYQSVTEPAGLAALFRSDVITETSHFSATNGQLVPLFYSYTHTGGPATTNRKTSNSSGARRSAK